MLGFNPAYGSYGQHCILLIYADSLLGYCWVSFVNPAYELPHMTQPMATAH